MTRNADLARRKLAVAKGNANMHDNSCGVPRMPEVWDGRQALVITDFAGGISAQHRATGIRR